MSSARTLKNVESISSTDFLINNGAGVEKYFQPAGRSSLWVNAREEDWSNWIWQQQERVTSVEKLSKIIDLGQSEQNAITKSHSLFKMAITPYYASLMSQFQNDCPIRLQAVPSFEEAVILPDDMDDPLGEEKDMPVPGISHRYPDRVLFYTTHNCPVYCRHCTRKRKVANPKSAPANSQLEAGIEYISNNPQIRDVVLSGGDPLSNSDERLEFILQKLREIPHVQIIRLGTRNLVTLPQRVTDKFANMLKKYGPIFVHTHFNHPRETTLEAFLACRKLAEAGCVLNNQMVLLKGINDSPEVVRELNQRLLMMRVQPYYIYLCDKARGISHFRTPIEKGLEIISKLRGWTSGMAVPHFVVDLPGGGGKVPLLPEYVVSREGKNWKFRNYKGDIFDYSEG